MIKVGVLGALGRMGQEIMKAVIADDELELVVGIDPLVEKMATHGFNVNLVAGLEIMKPGSVDVLIDFTTAASVRTTMDFCLDASVNLVVGTSGITSDDINYAYQLFGGPESPNIVIASNFAIGAVLMMHFAKIAAPHFENAEIIEYHHDQKIDSPSGTAVTTAEIMGLARNESGKDRFPADKTEKHAILNSRGAVGDANIPIHAVRIKGVVANQEVILGTQGQTLVIKHETIDRSAFMPGIILATKRVNDAEGVTLGIEKFLGID